MHEHRQLLTVRTAACQLKSRRCIHSHARAPAHAQPPRRSLPSEETAVITGVRVRVTRRCPQSTCGVGGRGMTGRVVVCHNSSLGFPTNVAASSFPVSGSWYRTVERGTPRLILLVAMWAPSMPCVRPATRREVTARPSRSDNFDHFDRCLLRRL